MIKREDLVAAAAVGLLQYRQIDPLLVFLLQRDVRIKRQALLAQTSVWQGGVNSWLSCLAGLLGIVTVTLFAVLFSSRDAQSFGVGGLFLGTALYGASTFSRRCSAGRTCGCSATVPVRGPFQAPFASTPRTRNLYFTRWLRRRSW